MSESNHPESNDTAADRALRGGLKVNPLSAEAMQRIRAATEAEWRNTTQAPARPRGRRFAMVASLSAIAVAALAIFLAASPGANSDVVFGQVAALKPPGLIEMKLLQDSPLSAGSTLHVGLRLEARGEAVVNLQEGGNLRIARASELEIQATDAVRITRGELYVDIPPGAHAASSFRVLTDAGEFRHLGTQFAVMIADGQTRLRVREGKVFWRASSGDSTIPAGTEVTIDRQGAATRQEISTAGRDWSWTEAMAPDAVIENRPLLEFLQWFARETGRELQIDEQSRELASAILMHGDVKGLTLTEALSAVMATTSTLKYELPEGIIRVSSTRDPKAPRS